MNIFKTNHLSVSPTRGRLLGSVSSLDDNCDLEVNPVLALMHRYTSGPLLYALGHFPGAASDKTILIKFCGSGRAQKNSKQVNN